LNGFDLSEIISLSAKWENRRSCAIVELVRHPLVSHRFGSTAPCAPAQSLPIAKISIVLQWQDWNRKNWQTH
jgi:hypothetical protein